MSFWQGFEKKAANKSKAAPKKDNKDNSRSGWSLPGGVLGLAAGEHLANKAYGHPKGSHIFTPVAGALVGSQLGSILNRKHRESYEKS